MIDLSLMNDVEINPGTMSARVGGGATIGEFDAAGQEHGLGVPTGTVSSIGIGGLTLGGGSCYLSRRFGLTLDSLVSAKVVIADGRVVTASGHENSDLFWAITRGERHVLLLPAIPGTWRRAGGPLNHSKNSEILFSR